MSCARSAPREQPLIAQLSTDQKPGARQRSLDTDTVNLGNALVPRAPATRLRMGLELCRRTQEDDAKSRRRGGDGRSLERRGGARRLVSGSGSRGPALVDDDPPDVFSSDEQAFDSGNRYQRTIFDQNRLADEQIKVIGIYARGNR